MTQEPTIDFNSLRAKAKELAIAINANKYQSMLVNARHPSKAKVYTYRKSIQQARKRAQLRIARKVDELSLAYCMEQGIDYELFQEKVREDPSLLEAFYEDAIKIIPKELL